MVWTSLPSVATWFSTKPAQRSAIERQPSRRSRETLSQRMKRVASSGGGSNVLSFGQSSSVVSGTEVSTAKMASARQLHSLEELCIQEVVRNPARLHEGCFDAIPDHIRQDVFERLFNRNHLMLHGKLLRSIIIGAHFTELSLKHASNLRDADLLAIAPSLVAVRRLDISHCPYVSDDGIAGVLACCHSISSLRLERLPDLTGDLSFGAEGHPSGALTALTLLSVAMCPKLTSTALDYIREGARELRSLDLSSCNGLHPDSIAKTAFPHLTWLSLAACPRYTDIAVQSVLRGCSKLEKIDVSGCTQLGDAVLKVMAARIEGLRELNISFLDRITDEGVAMIAMGCPELRVLQMEQTEITDQSLRELADNARNLRELNVAFCHFLSESALLECWSKCRLRLLNVNHCRSISLQTRFWLMAKAGNHRDGAGDANDAELSPAPAGSVGDGRLAAEAARDASDVCDAEGAGGVPGRVESVS